MAGDRRGKPGRNGLDRGIRGLWQTKETDAGTGNPAGKSPAGPGNPQPCDWIVPGARLPRKGRKQAENGIQRQSKSVVRPGGTIQAVPVEMPLRRRSWQVSVDMGRKIRIVCGTAPAVAEDRRGPLRELPFSPPHE